MKRLVSISAAATFAVLASAGLCRGSPVEIRRGDIDLSSPYIPPARPKVTVEEKRAIRDRMRLAQEKRDRKAAKLRALVAKGSLQAV
ncbi:hypothetical protein AU381_00110 [Sinorhizobium glycinis]|uniref:Uncharacterized protein n=1 Tax=Sinorhizobium glycinis TaxID=1472378 RepID=A0A178XYV1_9HYPH|nr:hypothetical protein [Sinorhizobium glycinis]OAP40366.1 hypothetical protein AU381_00110 [Sinorhizobium glycinis]